MLPMRRMVFILNPLDKDRQWQYVSRCKTRTCRGVSLNDSFRARADRRVVDVCGGILQMSRPVLGLHESVTTMMGSMWGASCVGKTL